MAKKPSPQTGRKRRKPAKRLPACRAILICEKVIKDAYLRTMTLVGVVTKMQVRRDPLEVLPFFVFAQLGDGDGNYDYLVEIQDDVAKMVLGRSPATTLTLIGRADIRDMIVHVPAFVPEHAGPYAVAVFVDGIEVGHQRFNIPERRSGDVP